METKDTPRFLELVRNPLQNLNKTNGWQRIWIALSGFMLICQFIYILFSIPNIFSYIEEKNNKQSEVLAATEWIQKNKSMCESVATIAEEAIAKNNAYMVENPFYREAAIRCNRQTTVEKNATEELENIKYRFNNKVSNFLSSLFATVISFGLVTTPVYLLGWALGWIRKGFKSNK
jgi:amino acid transporter